MWIGIWIGIFSCKPQFLIKRESFLNKLSEMCTADVCHKAKFISYFSNVLISLITIPSYIILVLVMDIWGRYMSPSTTTSLFLGTKVLDLNCFMTWGNRCLWWWCWYQELPALELHSSRSVQDLVPSSPTSLKIGYQYLLSYLPIRSGQWEEKSQKKEIKIISITTFG